MRLRVRHSADLATAAAAAAAVAPESGEGAAELAAQAGRELQAVAALAPELASVAGARRRRGAPARGRLDASLHLDGLDADHGASTRSKATWSGFPRPSAAASFRLRRAPRRGRRGALRAGGC